MDIIVSSLFAATSDCYMCDIPLDNQKKQPTTDFYLYLSLFLISKPSPSCPYGGLGKYHNFIQIKNDRVHFIIEAYHSVLNTTEDHVRAVESARNLCANMTEAAHIYFRKIGLISQQDAEQFVVQAYSPFYVFYEHYIHIWSFTRLAVIAALITVFLVHLLLGGLSWLVSLAIVASVCIIAMETFGIMIFLNGNVTYTSTSYMLICVGISARYVVIFVDRFSLSLQKLSAERQAHAVQVMCRPLLWGVVCNKLFWLVPMGLAQPQYIKLFGGMCFCGSLFGLLFLPTMVHFIG